MAPNKDIRKKIERLIRVLASAIHVRTLYGQEHKITKETIEAFHSILQDIFAEREEVTIGVIGHEIAFEEEPFYEMSKQMTGFIDHLKRLKAEKLSFSKGVEPSFFATRHPWIPWPIFGPCWKGSWRRIPLLP